MKKIFLLITICYLTVSTANANTVSRFLNSYNKNRYYYHPAQYNGYYHNSNYYNNNNYCPYHRHDRYYRNRRYYKPPVIHKTNIIRKSYADFNEIKVSHNPVNINGLEKKVFNQTYEYDSFKNRIERLEQKMFGAVQNGDLYERYNTLNRMVKINKNKFYNDNYYGNSYADNSYRPPLFSGSSGAGWKNTLLGNFRNQILGVPTGFTPAMDPAFMDYFEAERAMSGYGQNSDYVTNRSYHKYNSQTGSKSGVTILD